MGRSPTSSLNLMSTSDQFGKIPQRRLNPHTSRRRPKTDDIITPDDVASSDNNISSGEASPSDDTHLTGSLCSTPLTSDGDSSRAPTELDVPVTTRIESPTFAPPLITATTHHLMSSLTPHSPPENPAPLMVD
ncbi:hypothetical protein L2E82_44598 [Cichorium intybus]|uniref:Uncharacterized protein n=1 Tax=Cichorium intybus TaxID=13427 RepID=A0ACB8ZR04_CICIN|nr:hypothetical protein L2E82_44598 [Cichorium intybus]